VRYKSLGKKTGGLLRQTGGQDSRARHSGRNWGEANVLVIFNSSAGLICEKKKMLGEKKKGRGYRRKGMLPASTRIEKSHPTS